MTASKLLTAEQLAERWQLPTSQVYRLTRKGRLPAVKLGRYYRYRRDVIEKWERAGRSVVTRQDMTAQGTLPT